MLLYYNNFITVHKWTNAEVIDWLTNSVHLPQYADIFSSAGINGSVIPRFVMDIKMTILTIVSNPWPYYRVGPRLLKRTKKHFEYLIG